MFMYDPHMYQSVSALRILLLTIETLVLLQLEMYCCYVTRQGGGVTVGFVTMFTLELYCVVRVTWESSLVSRLEDVTCYLLFDVTCYLLLDLRCGTASILIKGRKENKCPLQ